MKTKHYQVFAALIAASMTFSAVRALAQDAATPATATAAAPAAAPTTAVAPAPQLPYGVSEILRLSQAKVPDETIIMYIQNAGNSYGLSADQIIYLQQQGVSSSVINVMLSQPKPGVMAPSAGAAPAPSATQMAAPVYDSQPAPQVVTVAPSVTAIDPSAAAAYSTYYYNTYPNYYYPAYGYYGCYPGVSVSFGWRGGFGGWHGGYGGGWHGGGHR